jgi:outer membrane lipoprotein SlyB
LAAKFLEEAAMRKSLIAATAFAALLMIPTAAGAQEAAAGAATGATAGAITGAVVGGPVGAAVGAGVGATVGAAAGDAAERERERSQERVIIEERAPSVTERTCVEGASGTQCVETRR